MIDCKVNKELKIGTRIAFFVGSTVKDGTIIEKETMDKGDIGFKIETDGKFTRVKHRNLDLYCIYK